MTFFFLSLVSHLLTGEDEFATGKLYFMMRHLLVVTKKGKNHLLPSDFAAPLSYSSHICSSELDLNFAALN